MVALLFALFSIPAVYSYIIVPAMNSQGGNTEYFLFKHTILVATGFLLMFYAHKLSYKYYSRLAQIGIWAAGIFLVLTLLFGSTVNSATRWFMGFQPSDFAKIALVIFVARKLAQNQDKITNFRQGVLPIILPVGIICGLILPADFSTAAMLGAICLILMFIGRVAIKHMLATIGIGLVGFLLLIGVNALSPADSPLLPRVETWQNRMEAWWTGNEAESTADTYQSDMAEIVIANGELWPQEPGSGTAKNILPLAWADFIYAAIIEEYGSILGGVGLVLLYLVLLFRGIRIGARCNKPFGTFLAVGLCLMLVFQAFTNMAVAVGLFPVTGQTLPMLSMGGTSLWFTCIAIGIVLSVSREVYPENEVDELKNIAVA